MTQTNGRLWSRRDQLTAWRREIEKLEMQLQSLPLRSPQWQEMQQAIDILKSVVREVERRENW